MTAPRFAQLETPRGDPVRMALPPRHDPLGDAVLHGRYETPDAALLVFDLVSDGSVLLDLGAHLGAVALVAAGIGARVVAVEASPVNAASLRESRDANGFTRLQVVEAAVSDVPGTVHFHQDGPYGRVTSDGGPGVIEVRAAPVTDLLAELDVARVDVVKMDVEGHELAAIDGMEPLMSPCDAPPVVFESNRHTLHHAGRSPSDLLARFEALGYRTYLVGAHELIEAGSSSLQVETVSDYLATKQGAPPGWRVRSPLSPDELAVRIEAEAHHPLKWSRAAVARALGEAGPDLRRRDGIETSIGDLLLDPEPEVAEAAETTLRQWAAGPWTGVGHPPGEGLEGLSDPLGKATGALRTISAQAGALARAATRTIG